MRKHKPLAIHLVKHRYWLTEYSVVADIQRYRTRAMLARRVPMHGVRTAPLRRSLSEAPYDAVCFSRRLRWLSNLRWEMDNSYNLCILGLSITAQSLIHNIRLWSKRYSPLISALPWRSIAPVNTVKGPKEGPVSPEVAWSLISNFRPPRRFRWRRIPSALFPIGKFQCTKALQGYYLDTNVKHCSVFTCVPEVCNSVSHNEQRFLQWSCHDTVEKAY